MAATDEVSIIKGFSEVFRQKFQIIKVIARNIL